MKLCLNKINKLSKSSIWIITPSLPQNIGGLSNTTSRYAKHLTDIGYVVVIIPIPPYNELQKLSNYNSICKEIFKGCFVFNLNVFSKLQIGIDLYKYSYEEINKEIPRLVAMMALSISKDIGNPECIFHLYISRNIQITHTLSKILSTKLILCPRGSDINRDIWSDNRGPHIIEHLSKAESIILPNLNIKKFLRKLDIKNKIIVSPNSTMLNEKLINTKKRKVHVLVPGPFSFKKGGVIPLKIVKSLKNEPIIDKIDRITIVIWKDCESQPSEYISELEKIYQNKLSIIYTLTSKKFQKLLTKSSVVLLSSLGEGFNNTALEALLTGNLICSTNVGAIKYLKKIFPKKCYLFEQGNYRSGKNILLNAIEIAPKMSGGDYRQLAKMLWKKEHQCLLKAL